MLQNILNILHNIINILHNIFNILHEILNVNKIIWNKKIDDIPNMLQNIHRLSEQ